MMNTSIVVLRLMNRGATAGKQGGGEKYILTQPNMYVRGILFGKMKYELGDHSYVRCSELDLVADIEFKVKGFFTGGYNVIGGVIKRESTGEVLYEISGSWNGEMHITDKKVCFLASSRAQRVRRVSLALQSSTPLTRSRLATVNSSSTQPTPVQLPPPFVPSLNRNLGNLNAYGNKSSQHSRKGTKKPRRMKNSRLRIVNVRRLERERQMVSNGYRVTLDRWIWRGVRRNSWISC